MLKVVTKHECNTCFNGIKRDHTLSNSISIWDYECNGGYLFEGFCMHIILTVDFNLWN